MPEEFKTKSEKACRDMRGSRAVIASNFIGYKFKPCSLMNDKPKQHDHFTDSAFNLFMGRSISTRAPGFSEGR
jgi:hypothetical protein